MSTSIIKSTAPKPRRSAAPVRHRLKGDTPQEYRASRFLGEHKPWRRWTR